MQKVACPITIVHIETWMWPAMKNELSAMPVTMPGSAIGRTKRNETRSRPKNENRATPNAAIEPSTTATPVATNATRTESQTASRTSWECHATENQCPLKPGIGHDCTFDLLNA